MLTMSPQELDVIREQCRKLARKKARLSGLASVVPIPAFDIAAEVRLLSKLLPEISDRFGLTPEKIREMPTEQREKVRWHMRNRKTGFFGLIATRALLRRSLQSYVGRLLTTQVAKFIPLTGSLVAATLGYQVLRRIADQYIDDCYEVGRALWQGGAPPAPQAV
jgi:uncharacterized protein (DUF697 family)